MLDPSKTDVAEQGRRSPDREVATVNRRVMTAGFVVAVSLFAAGCHSGSPSSRPSPSPALTPSAAPSLSPSTGAERDALTAYRGMWNAFVEAAKTSDAESQAVRTYTSDNALKLIVSALATNRHDGKVIKGDVVINPQITGTTPGVDPTEASIADCVNDEKWLEYKTSGELWDNNPGGRHRTTATVKRTDETWKVSAFTLEAAGTC